MSLKNEFGKMVTELTAKFTIPPIADIFFPSYQQGGQPKDAHFMAINLSGGAAGISFVFVPDEMGEKYIALQPSDFVGKDPLKFALEFGNEDPIKDMISLAAINAICQHIMRETNFPIGYATDSLGLLSVSAGDKVGMVGLFFGMVKTIEKAGADLVIIEKQEELIKKYPDLPITLDPANLNSCHKILCTSTTVLNNSLDEILSHCSPDAFVSIIGPTAGYFPDALFARGVDVVGGRAVKDGEQFLRLLKERKRWGAATQRTCFRKDSYTSII
jgi:uncharacterized protein (DUF4213/DUF364 family)